MTKESQLDHMGDASSLSCLGERLGLLQSFIQARQLNNLTSYFESEATAVLHQACPSVCWRAQQCIRDTENSLARHL